MNFSPQSVLTLLAATLLLTWGTGCQQSMSISVERLKVSPHLGTPTHEVDELRIYLTGTIGHQVALSGAALRAIQGRLTEYENLKDNIIFEDLNLNASLQRSIEAPETGYPDLDALLARNAAMTEQISEAATLTADYQFVGPGRQAVLLATLSSTVAQARTYLGDVNQSLAAVKRVNTRNMQALDTGIRVARAGLNDGDGAEAQLKTLQSLRGILDDVPRASAALRQAQRITAGTRPRFGGYASESVHTISAGDPAYDFVLEADAYKHPISAVSSTAWGDSTIMFVQESPTQMRVFTVDVDGTQLAQNIMLITDKALQAAVNHLNPLPLGGAPASE